MRGDQTNPRLQYRAWFVAMAIVLVSLLSTARGPRVFGQRTLEAPEAAYAEAKTTAPAASNDPIDLAARQVEVWQQDGVRWVHLVGQVAILQGIDGPRGDEAIVRVTQTAAPGGVRSQAEIYVEGGRQATTTAKPVLVWTTDQEIRLQPYEATGFIDRKAPPADLPILDRSGLIPKPNRAKQAAAPTGSAARPKSSQTAAPAPRPVIASTNVPRTPTMTPPEPLNRAPAPSPLPKPVSFETADPVKLDPEVAPAQDPGVSNDFSDMTATPPVPLDPLDTDPTLEDGAVVPEVPETPSPVIPGSGPEPDPVADPSQLPDAILDPLPPATPSQRRPQGPGPPRSPIEPGSQRMMLIWPRNSGPNFETERFVYEGTETIVIRGGVRIVTTAPQFGIIELAADNAIVWRKLDPNSVGVIRDGSGKEIDDARQPLEFYLEGDVVFKQDERKVAGNGDQKTYRAKQAYFNLLTERFVGLDAELSMFAPGLVAPTRVKSPKIEQYRPFTTLADGSMIPGFSQIRADQAVGTGSRFPTPGYRFKSKSVDISRVLSRKKEPKAGLDDAPPGTANPPEDLTWLIDARQNVFYMGRVPVFYYPRFLANADDIEPPIRMVNFRTNNYFGQQLLTDWNGFRLLGMRKPKNVDLWNVDFDYLSARTKSFPALGSEIGWFGKDLINDLNDPYHEIRGAAPTFTNDYFGYFDIWGLRDFGRDTLGSGPAIITNNIAAGNVGYQRGGGGRYGAVPPFQDYRGKLVFRHMQRFFPDDEEHLYQDLRVQVEVGYSTDRYFIEEYYKRLFDTGLDQETLTYGIYQKDNQIFTVLTEANLQSWYTDTQWLPKLEYYRLGDSLLGNRLSYSQSSGVDYGNTHTANEVNNPHLFAFLPYDPISNTSGVMKTGRVYTNQELDLPLNFFDNAFRVVPYTQGQLVGWSNQINGSSVGRAWGAVGVRAEVMAWKAYPWVQSELLNVHGINHKINLEADYRDAFSNLGLNSIGIQDDLDDNNYESTRRYFAMTNYAGGLLPAQYDPRFLILRHAISPIAGTTDVQAAIETLHLGVHQRLQTKRGAEGRRRIIDYMTLDLDTTYFPYAARDNFNKSFGQNTYNWQWFIGDRTSIVSYGWFEFFNIGGNPIYKTNISRHNDPFGLNVITSGIAINRPPRGNIFIGYSVVDTGPITTSALNASLSYWLAPKWYGSFSTSYDFGNAILLGSMFSVTRVGADYLSTVGLSVDPQRQSYMFSFTVTPRLGPAVQNGAAPGLGNFDPRYAPTQ